MKKNLRYTAQTYPLDQNFKQEKLSAYFWMPHLLGES